MSQIISVFQGTPQMVAFVSAMDHANEWLSHIADLFSHKAVSRLHLSRSALVALNSSIHLQVSRDSNITSAMVVSRPLPKRTNPHMLSDETPPRKATR